MARSATATPTELLAPRRVGWAQRPAGDDRCAVQLCRDRGQQGLLLGLQQWRAGNGDVSGTAVLTPVLVSGNHAFAQINAGYSHTCGKTTLGVGWCWGNDQYGDLGDGNTVQTVRSTPVKVLGPSRGRAGSIIETARGS